jgi:hypothetical protein
MSHHTEQDGLQLEAAAQLLIGVGRGQASSEFLLAGGNQGQRKRLEAICEHAAFLPARGKSTEVDVGGNVPLTGIGQHFLAGGVASIAISVPRAKRTASALVYP